MKHLNLWLIIAYLILNFTATSQAEQRLALVIGNAAYLGGSDLRNPVNDAEDLAKVLRHLGFEVTLKTNLNQQQMDTVVSEFGQKLRSDKENIGLFYFSGHGAQYNNENYLMPIGAMNSLDSPQQLYYRTVNANYVLDEMKAAKNQMNIVILDACRYNIFRSKFKGKRTRPGDAPLPSMNNGLAAPKQTPSGFLIAYATAANDFANDFTNDGGRNSPYLKHLKCQMQKHNLMIEQMFKQVRVAVKAETDGSQEPAYYAAIDNDFFFVPEGSRIEPIQGCETSVVCPECSQLLRVCEKHFQAHRLTSGVGGTALACYKEVLAKVPNHAEALAGLDKIAARYVTWIETALSEGKKDKAKSYLEGLRKVNPESPKYAALEERIYPLLVCERHFQAHRLTIAASCYKKVLEKEPSNTEALAAQIEARYITWIEAALSEGKKDKAKQYLEGLGRVNPESPKYAALEERIYPLLVCERHFQVYRLTITASCYKKVLEKEPSNTEALAGLKKIEARYITWIEAALSEGKKDKAKQYLEDLGRVNPESPKYAALEERIYPLLVCERHFQAHRLTIAASCYKKVLEKEPSNTEALAAQIEARYVTWIEAALSEGKKDKAKPYLEGLRMVNPESPKYAALEQRIFPKPVIPVDANPPPPVTTPSAFPLEGSCFLHNFMSVMTDKHGTLDTSQGVWVLRHEAPVYPTFDASNSSSTQAFGEYLLPVKVAKHPDTGGQRVQVKNFGTGTAVGWMEGYDLLCRIKPLQSEKGLDRKVFVKTPTSHEYRLSTVPVYPSYEGPCNGDCEHLARFELYFIFAEEKFNRRYLVLKVHELKDKPFSEHSSSPMGWVKYDHTIPWDTTLSLRPKDEVYKILGYKKPEDINNQKASVEIAGGNIWYTYPIHIPILDINEEQKYYHVAAPAIGVGVHEGVLSSLKLVDVFFLLDGTDSMGPYINAVGGAAQEIAENLRNELKFKENSFRFGFRVYRDTYADSTLKECQGGVCEGLPLSAGPCSSDEQASQANWAEFKNKIDEVTEISNDNDDYPEKLFDGLRQTLFDMASCPKRTKLLFVIGDHGDRQQQWPQDIVDGLKGLADRVIVFFIQTPNNSSQARNPGSYQQAYRAYKVQAYELLKKILPPEIQDEAIDDYFLSLDQKQLITQIVEGVKQYSPSARINEIEQALAGGKSLQEIIDQYMAEGDMPVIYNACPKLGQQCKTVIEHGVIEFYIPIEGSKIQEETWMTENQLMDWLTLLKAFKHLKGLPVQKQRVVFAYLLRKQIQQIIGGYPPTNIVLSEWLAKQRKQVLPMRQDSPFLQYSFDDIRRKIEGCEMSLLINWVNEIRKVLQKVSNDSTQKVAFRPKYPTSSIFCPLSDKGKKVPESLEFERSAPLGSDDSYRYEHNLYGKTVYWLPVEFLP